MPQNITFDFSNQTQDQIKTLLKENKIALTSEEALKIQIEILKRPPTLAELILWGIQGSEHCSYKSSRPFLKQFPTTASNVMVGVGEDAGIVEICKDNTGKKYGAVISHESHNSPSQVVPFEGAATGIGGNVRDVNCMGAKVIGCSDSLRFGDIENSKTNWLHHGVVEGIAGYGNPIGVPNIGGDLYYDSSYNGACLVNVVTLGVIAEDEIIHSHAPKDAQGYDLILIGKPTDNSGFGGASFSSKEVKEEQKEANKGAVQEPNAFLKRHILKANYELFKILKSKNLINKVGFKDLGAGGIACASVEIADGSGYGAEIDLEKVHISMEDLDPSVILCSETQERFLWAVPSDLTQTILDHYNITFDFPNVSKGAKASLIGKILDGDQLSTNGEPTGKYIVNYNGDKIIDALASDITKGIVYDRPYSNPNQEFVEPQMEYNLDYQSITHTKSGKSKTLTQILLEILGHQNVASREPVYENFDKNVQGLTVIEAGQADAVVLQPFKFNNYPEEIRNVGIVFKQDNNPFYGKISPYLGGIRTVAECIRNVACVGGYPQALTDCLNFGNPEKPEQMWAFVESVRGISDACKSFRQKQNPLDCLPIVSGNVSLYKESNGEPIAPSPIVSIVGNIKNVNNAIKMSFVEKDSLIILVGKRKDECGGSIYYSLFGELGANVPAESIEDLNIQVDVITDLISNNLVLSCHDISEGGIACTIAEMAFGNSIGAEITLHEDCIDSKLSIIYNSDKILFGESGGFVIEVSKDNLVEINKKLSLGGIESYVIGNTTKNSQIKFTGLIDVNLAEAKSIWQNGLRSKL